MKTLLRLYLIFAIMVLSMVAARAAAQTWYVQPNTLPLAPADTVLLPYSLTFDYQPNAAGWVGSEGNTWMPIWPRNASGAWYRIYSYTQPNAINRKWQPYPYTCTVQGLGFRCLDKVRAIYRNVSCPAQMAIGPLKFWRSEYNAAWQEKGLFTSSVGPFVCNTGRTVALQSAVVTNNGQYLNCGYGPITSQGPGLTSDVYCYRR